MNHVNCGCETKNISNFVDPSNDWVIIDGGMLFKHLLCGNTPKQLWESPTAESTTFVTLCLKKMDLVLDLMNEPEGSLEPLGSYLKEFQGDVTIDSYLERFQKAVS